MVSSEAIQAILNCGGLTALFPMNSVIDETGRLAVEEATISQFLGQLGIEDRKWDVPGRARTVEDKAASRHNAMRGCS